MSAQFFSDPILNSPYDYPGRHWKLDAEGQPTGEIVESRRRAEFITPIPQPRKRKGKQRGAAHTGQQELGISHETVADTATQQYDPTSVINEVRNHVDRWRKLKDERDWKVTPETARLLTHWRHHRFNDMRPFFCQVEAVETAIYLTEVAPKMGKSGERFLEYLSDANESANPGLSRLALKMATGSGKTTVMAMLIAWQTINAGRHPNSKNYSRSFLIVTPGITIRDRLRVLYPNDPDNYYRTRELVPGDMLHEVDRAKIVITNFHAFKLRERLNISSGGRALLQGRGPELKTLETEGQMIQRVMPALMGSKNIVVMNDEAHHCYREKPDPEAALTGDEKSEAARNSETARVWISGIETVGEVLGVKRIIDLSATPTFLQGSGYAEGTLFPWTMSDFSLMDAIECGIVKLPRVPISDNLPANEIPLLRNLWKHIGTKMPKKGRGKGKSFDPLSLPPLLETALEELYGHYRKTWDLWVEAGVPVPPVFIIVCNNTATSKLVYDYISGFEWKGENGKTQVHKGHFPLFRNYDDDGLRRARPHTFLIDSEQLESGDALDKGFRTTASDEIEQFRREIVQRTGDRKAGESITDTDLLREVMNTVGKEGKLGEPIRCVVSVSMLSEGWDANTVTHVLGIRAFGTQLLCEQVVGRALRRQSYELNEEGLFNVEYADVLGIPFDFTAKPVVAPPQPPRKTVHVHAVRPERDSLEIRFPRVSGYRTELPEERLEATFNEDSILTLTPELVGPTKTRMAGIIGEQNTLDLEHLDQVRTSTILYRLTQRLLVTRWRDADGSPKLFLFGQLKQITRRWLSECLRCTGNTYPAQILYETFADMACERIMAGITRSLVGEKPVVVVLDPYNPLGTTAGVSFTTSKENRYQTAANKCHVNWAILDSSWEGELCRIVEEHPRVTAYVKNQNLGFEVPYRFGSVMRTYIPDFIVLVDDGKSEPLQLVVEVKGYRGEDAKEKKATMENYWVPGANNAKVYGRWAFAECTDIFEMEKVFGALIDSLSGGAVVK